MNKESVTDKNNTSGNAIDNVPDNKKPAPAFESDEADAIWEDISRAHIYLLRIAMERHPRAK